MELLELIKKALIDGKYDGLAYDNCGCEVDDLCPCNGCDRGEGILDCKTAHKRWCLSCDVKLPEECPNEYTERKLDKFCMVASDVR